MTDSNKSFGDFWSRLGQKPMLAELLSTASLIAAVGIAFHLLYPMPFTFPDSGAYVLSAKEGVFNFYRPMGYSGYMGFVHLFGQSTTVLFAFSYTLHGLALLFLLMSARYLLDIPGRWYWPLALFSVLAPRLIFSTNFIMSDSLFASLTMLFVATALWVVFSRSKLLLVAHLLCFIALYKVRYSGMFYVPVSMAAVWLSFKGAPLPKRTLALVPLLVFLIMFTLAKKEYREQTGVDTFSGFSGWQLINNAAVLLPEAKTIPAYEFEPQLRGFHSFIASCPDTLFRREYAMSTHNMWGNDMPYKQYMFYNNRLNGYPYANGWVVAGKLYGEYAAQMIKRYPGKYFTRFIIPSFVSNFKCWDFSEERGEFRNEPLYHEYFGIEADSYKHRRIFSALMPVRKAMNWIYWLMLGACTAYFCTTLRRRNYGDKCWQGAALTLFFILFYIATSAVSSPNTTWRYTMPIFVPSLVFMAWCVSRLTANKGSQE